VLREYPIEDSPVEKEESRTKQFLSTIISSKILFKIGSLSGKSSLFPWIAIDPRVLSTVFCFEKLDTDS
jgi:hypothetical protein